MVGVRFNGIGDDMTQDTIGDRIPISIEGLDELMEGGIPKDTVTLVAGPAGSLKSSVTLNILINHIRTTGAKVLYLSLEQNKESLLDHISHIGIDITGLEKNLILTDLTRLRSTLSDGNLGQIDWYGNIINGIQEHKDQLGIDVVALDSLDAMEILANSENPRNKMFQFFEGLRTMDLTAFIITEMPNDRVQFGSQGIEAFLADGVIHIDMRREGNNVGLYIGVVKMRKTKHTRKYFPLLLEEKGRFSIVRKG